MSDSFAEAVEVECFATSKVFDAGYGLGGASKVHATPSNEAFRFLDGGFAGRALVVDVFGKRKRDAVRRAFFDDYPFDGGDDFACFFDYYGITNANVFALDFFFVVKGGAGDGGAGDENGFEFGDWG